MNEMTSGNPICLGLKTIASITPTICQVMDITPTNISTAEVIDEVMQYKNNVTKDTIEKCLIYAPDAIGFYLTIQFKDWFDKVEKLAPQKIRLCSIFPPMTPVCFASMFTGAQPEVHGITTYMKPVLKCQTIFDVFIKAKKKIAIVAVSNSSIDVIFRERKIDYFSEKYDPEVTSKTLDLLENGNYDLIVVYHQEYDDSLHDTQPLSDKSIKAMKNNIRSFEMIAETFNNNWKESNRLILFAPDHGAHIGIEDGKGTHGNNIPEDMIIQHYFGIYKGEK